MSSNHLILCCSLLLLPSIFPSIRIFSSESGFRIRWSKYWSFSISPSNDYLGLISFRTDWFDLLADQGILKSLLQHHSSKASILWHSAFPGKKKCKNAKWLSEEALQIAVKRREAKGRGEKERYTHLNAESQRIARSDKKAFLSDQCQEIEENSRMGKTSDLFKKIRDTKGIFHAKLAQ